MGGLAIMRVMSFSNYKLGIVCFTVLSEIRKAMLNLSYY